MSIIEDMLAAVRLPKVVRARQLFDKSHVEDLRGEVRRQVLASPAYRAVGAGSLIAVTAGSRGIAGLPETTRAVCDLLREKAALPFIVPAMGGHGGATAEGQLRLLRENGITEESMGAPIRSSMEVVEVGRLPDGRGVYIDKLAHEADGIVLLGRIKPHTSFKGSYESGLMKMMAVGLGNQAGAFSCHKAGMQRMARTVAEAAELILGREKILFGVGVIENSLGRVAEIACMEAADIPRREPELLRRANALLPRAFFRDCDVLVVTEMGREHSGAGIDPNVTGRWDNPYAGNDMDVNRLTVLSLSEKSRGDATGVGLSDIITRRLYDAIDPVSTYASGLASTMVGSAHIPMVMETDELAVRAAVKTCHLLPENAIRFAVIKNTRDLEILYLSEALAEEAVHGNVELEGEPAELFFSKDGRLELEF